MVERDKRQLYRIAQEFEETPEDIDLQELQERLREEEWQEFTPNLLGLIIDHEHPYYGRIGQIQNAIHDFLVEGERKFGFILNMGSVSIGAAKEAMFIFDKGEVGQMGIQIKDSTGREGTLTQWRDRHLNNLPGIYFGEFGEEVVEEEDCLMNSNPSWEIWLTPEQIEELYQKNNGWHTSVNTMVRIPAWSYHPVVDAELKQTGIPVWLIGKDAIFAEKVDIVDLAKQYNLPQEEMVAALVWFKENLEVYGRHLPESDDFSPIKQFDPYHGRVVIPEWTKGSILNAELVNSNIAVWVLIKRAADLMRNGENIYKVCEEYGISKDDFNQGILFYRHHSAEFNAWANLGRDFDIPQSLIKTE
jgi:hypothetical protein